jgi:predicted Zn-dependent protease
MKNSLKNIVTSAIVAVILFNYPANSYAQDAAAAKLAGVDITKDPPLRTPGLKPKEKSLEEGFWEESRKAETQAKTSGERTHHKELESYISELMQRIIPEYKSDTRVYVMERPFFNASMAPNGYTEVWTGLLLRAETEDEVAFVLGHEAGHYLHSHSITAYQNLKEKQQLALAASIVLTAATVAAVGNASNFGAAQDISNIGQSLVNIVYLGTMASFMGYTRDMEERADIYGDFFATSSGYNPKAGENIWKNLLNETSASDYQKVRNRPTRINIFGSHPLESQRITNLEIYNQKSGNNAKEYDAAKQKAARISYRAKIRPYIGEWLKDDLRRQDFGQTIFIINRMMIDNEDLGVLNFYKGEALKLKAQDLDSAANAYIEASKYPDAPKETQRQLGDVYRKQGKSAQAVEAYKKYVNSNPNAEDSWIVEDLITTLSKDSNQVQKQDS